MAGFLVDARNGTTFLGSQRGDEVRVRIAGNSANRIPPENEDSREFVGAMTVDETQRIGNAMYQGQ